MLRSPDLEQTKLLLKILLIDFDLLSFIFFLFVYFCSAFLSIIFVGQNTKEFARIKGQERVLVLLKPLRSFVALMFLLEFHKF